MSNLKRKMSALRGLDIQGRNRGQYDKILVIELERLLVCYHTTKKNQSSSRVDFQQFELKEMIKVRSDWPDFLKDVEKIFFVVIWTTLPRDAAQDLMKQVDPEDKIKYKLYEEDCERRNFDNGPPILLKTCEALGGDKTNVIFIDVVQL